MGYFIVNEFLMAISLLTNCLNIMVIPYCFSIELVGGWVCGGGSRVGVFNIY